MRVTWRNDPTLLTYMQLDTRHTYLYPILVVTLSSRCYDLHFTGGETKAQRSDATSTWLMSWKVANAQSELRSECKMCISPFMTLPRKLCCRKWQKLISIKRMSEQKLSPKTASVAYWLCASRGYSGRRLSGIGIGQSVGWSDF